MEQRKLELLSPAGSYESLKAALQAGADAVYVGGSKFGARAYAENIQTESVQQVLDTVHMKGKKIFLTVNTLLKDQEISMLYDYMKEWYEGGLDAAIVQDMGVFRFLKREFPDLALHASTQMSITGLSGARFLEHAGAERIVTAREISLKEIQNIREGTNLEIESFVHGALCYCYSGQCLFSSLVGGRSGNRGRCAQPCRLPYEAGGKGQKYLLSPKDICTLRLLPDLAEAGVYSLKIEGRMKRPEYTAGVTAIYRKYVDLYLEKGREGYAVEKEDQEQLEQLYSRSSFSEGYYQTRNGKEMLTIQKPSYNEKNQELLKRLHDKYADIQSKEKIKGKFILSEGKPAALEADFREHHLIVTGDIVQKAEKRPLTEEKAKAPVLQTGDTPFEFEQLICELDDNVFLPVQSIKQLRRQAMEQLSELVLSKYRRETAGRTTDAAKEKQKEPKVPSFHVYAEHADYVKALKHIPEINAFYIDSSAVGLPNETEQFLRVASECVGAGKDCYLAMPYIFRMDTQKQFAQIFHKIKECSFKGVLIRNFETVQFLKEQQYEGELLLDANMYTMNGESMRFWQEHGISMDTVPYELNERELKRRGCENSELIVYGNIPMMISAQCILKTTEGCKKSPGSLYMTDRTGRKFCVRHVCEACYNVIYNSTPLVLMDLKEQVSGLHPKSMRLSFTTESKEQAKEIAEQFADLYYRGKNKKPVFEEFTRGHFKRGIE